ncbi:hypothetical protein Aph01nite_74050 [Acrocarpospora phusangensis]|uniref:Uncharacterized protein n=1 Tax=Acrocarpospora phusangensis TaxID=1070424 RepID=A0A919QMQ4_9ACTN|nr:hypothetical protein [Acrocarpospora phusangensis]GIH29095.1 hypothetical protein Aph01nite_74050 [Acrocarpospora phusangensis]
MIELSADQQALQALARALGREADGKKLRRDLAKELRQALQPAVGEIKAGLMSIGSGGLPADGEPLRPAVARKIKAEARLSGRQTGARVRARRTEAVRGFRHAPKRLNSAKGWRRPVFGTGLWVVQLGKPGYFDDPLERRRGEFRTAVHKAMEDAAARIAASTQRR